MILWQVRKRRFSVYALASDGEQCPTKKGLRRADADLRERMMALFEQVAMRGKPHSTLRCRHLQGEVWEFKVQPKKGAGLRVLWFPDGERTFICTHSFIKDERKTPPQEIETAKRKRAEYFAAKACGPIQIKTEPELEL